VSVKGAEDPENSPRTAA